MKYLENFHHQITGNPNGPKLVFLHGLMGSASNWRRITPAFTDEFHILTFDQRGHGRSFQPDHGYDPDDFASDLHAILDELGWEQIFLVGHSMGGRNALAFAHRFAQRVTALVIEDIAPEAPTVSAIPALIEKVDTPFASREAAKKFFNEVYPLRIADNPQPRVVSQFFFTNIEQKPDGQFDWRFSKKAILAAAREGRHGELWPAWRGLRMPVLVVRGESSRDLPPELFARMLNELPAAQGVEIAGAGHWVHFDQPDAFIRTLKDFFDLKT